MDVGSSAIVDVLKEFSIVWIQIEKMEMIERINPQMLQS
jgi:hypothetical protein